ncbi:hypothetical protein IBHPHPPA_00038 [Salmonella phage KKP 3828]|uniref:EaA protein n=1 Tax=Salmonella phage KKP 3828 TaxID=3041358 RepID=A0AA50F3A5_9CAUD|nr:hypothetical protein IBHPHPPA_00038 [Salmonella phage KKP 3828]
MSALTKENIANLLQFNYEGSDCQANAEQWEVHELARIALASLEAEPVAYMTYKGYLLHAADPKLAEYSEPTPLYDAPPAPVSDSLLSELLAIAKKAADAADECAHAEWSDDSMEHSTAIADWERRAAMLQGAEPVSNRDELPDGWVLVPVEPTYEMLEAGDEQFGTYDVYRRMIAAAPQQEAE